MSLPWWQMEWPPKGVLFSLSSEVLNRASSHIWGRWYIPMFLFRDGLLTHIYNASFIVLMRFWSSLPTMLKYSIVVVWPVVLKWSYIWDGAFWCSLNLCPNVLEDCPIYSSSYSTLSHLYLYMTPLSLRMESLSLGATKRLLIVLPPLKYTVYCMLSLDSHSAFCSKEQPYEVFGCL